MPAEMQTYQKRTDKEDMGNIMDQKRTEEKERIHQKRTVAAAMRATTCGRGERRC